MFQLLVDKISIGILLIGTLLLGVDIAYSEDYPSKPIRIVCGGAGGASDITMRLISQALSTRLGQQLVIDNRGGAGGIIAAQTVAKATPDGYTLLSFTTNLWLLPLLQKVPYDPVENFSPITLAVRSPNILVVHPSTPVNSVKELISLAKSKPGQLNYGSGGSGSSPHLAAELFKAMTGTDIVRIAYKGGGPALNAVLGNQVQIMFTPTIAAPPHIKSGKLRALGVTSAQQSSLFPDLPTIAETVPGYESVSSTAIFAPIKTPMLIVKRLNRETIQVLKSAEMKERFFSTGVETVASSPEHLTATIKSEMARMGKVIKDAGIRSE